MTTIDVIVPVYQGLEELKNCLQSVVDSSVQIPYELVVIEDGSPNPAIGDFLEDFSSNHDITLLHNDKNLGFVATVNRGMALHPERDVLLLNSDTEVANDWLDRIHACAQSDARIATVTPFSNNATICSFPVFCQSNELPTGYPVERLDKIFAVANAGRSIDIPTAVGFCMYIKRDALHEVGLFDVEHFGRGYGEENDFCMRVVEKNWRNVLCCDTFVYHEGGVSFSDESANLMQNAGQVIHKLYPDYHQMIQDYIALDPARIFRLSVAIELLHQSARPVILAVSHRLSGGIEKHIGELANYLPDKAHFLLLKPVDKDTLVLQLDKLPITFSLSSGLDDLTHLLRYVGVDRLHFHHTLDITEEIWQLPESLGVPYDVTLHDHFFINGNPAQCDDKGKFVRDLTKQSTPFPLPVSLDQWQERQARHLGNAARIISPSLFTSALYREHFPDLEITQAYHPDWEHEAPYPATVAPGLAPDEPLKILVMGALSPEKGADVLEQAALLAKQKKLPLDFHLLGYAYRPLARAVTEHGSYDHSNVVELIHQIAPHLIWFPALIPETFSYTLSEALHTSLPILAPDIGAFPQRLKGRPMTWIEAWDKTPEEWCSQLQSLSQQIAAEERNQRYEWTSQQIPKDGFYTTDYLIDGEPKTDSSIAETIDLNWLARIFAGQPVAAAQLDGISKKERILLVIRRLQRTWIGKRITRMVPIQTQRNIKRRLSHKPAHEIKK